MAGALTISTLNDSSGVLATQNGMSGIAKAWVQFSVSGGTVTIRGSFNVSSVTRSSTGQYSVTFTTAMPDANYSALLSNSSQAGSSATNNQIFVTGSNGATSSAPSTTGFNFVFSVAYTGGNWDPNYATIAVFR